MPLTHLSLTFYRLSFHLFNQTFSTLGKYCIANQCLAEKDVAVSRQSRTARVDRLLTHLTHQADKGFIVIEVVLHTDAGLVEHPVAFGAADDLTSFMAFKTIPVVAIRLILQSAVNKVIVHNQYGCFHSFHNLVDAWSIVSDD